MIKYRKEPKYRKFPFGNVASSEDRIVEVNDGFIDLSKILFAERPSDAKHFANIISNKFGVSQDIAEEDANIVIGTLSDIRAIDYTGVGVNKNSEKSSGLYGIPIPTHISWHLTSRCNLACEFCYSRNREGELSYDLAMKVVDNLADAGVIDVVFGGGESFLYKGFLDIVKYCSDKDLRVGVTTHGGAMSPYIAERLPDAGFDYIGISLDGDEDYHDKVRGVGAFRKAVGFIKHSVKIGIRTQIVTVLTKDNMAEVDKIINIGSSLGVDKIIFKNLKITSDIKGDISKFSMSKDQKIKVWNSIIDSQDKFPAVKLDIGLQSDPEVSFLVGDRSVSNCSCGNMSAVIRENGQLSPCAYSNNFIGSIVDSSLKDIWWNYKNRDVLEFSKPKSCSN